MCVCGGVGYIYIYIYIYTCVLCNFLRPFAAGNCMSTIWLKPGHANYEYTQSLYLMYGVTL